MLPVPLNSSKITSSMRDPVSTRAVARMVSEPPFLDVAGRAEELLGRVEGAGVDAAGHDPACRRGPEVVGARRRVIPSRMMTTSLPDSTMRLARSMVSSATGCAPRRGGRRSTPHLALEPPLHVGDLLGPLVDEQHDQVHLGVVDLDRPRDLLQHGRLAGLGRRDDEAALALADRRDQVDDARRHVVGVVAHLHRSFSSGKAG